MKTNDFFEKLDRELADWRVKLEQARVKASLAKLELRDKEREIVERFEPAYERAIEKLNELGKDADERAEALRSGLEVGWKELRETYRKIREEQRTKKT